MGRSIRTGYKILYLTTVVDNDIPAISAPARKLIKKVIEERLTSNPIAFGKPLKYSLKGHRRLRVGDYRVIYRINLSSKVVIIITIKHRKDIYD